MTDTLQQPVIDTKAPLVATPEFMDVRDVQDMMRPLGNAAVNLWRHHYDSDIVPNIVSTPSKIVDDMVGKAFNESLEKLRDSSNLIDRTELPWVPTPERAMSDVVDTAEYYRRTLSIDTYAISNSLPGDGTSQGEEERAMQYAPKGNFPVFALKGDIAGKESDYLPIGSVRTYNEITVDDINGLNLEDDAYFMALAADILSPVRNEQTKISEEVLLSLFEVIKSRKTSIGNYDQVFTTNMWCLAVRNGYSQIAEQIKESLDETSALRYFMDSYRPGTVEIPSPELMRQNKDRYIGEYLEQGNDPEKLEKAEKPKVRIRLTSHALWSVAMRDDGNIRTGGEGTHRGPSRVPLGGGVYFGRRKAVERHLFGDAGIDKVEGLPIVYGYCTSDESEKTPSTESLDRIYGEIELVLKDEIEGVQKRYVYGDSLNAIALAGEEAPNRIATPELIDRVLDERVIAEQDVNELAEVISTLHGNDENTQYNPSANPYLECPLRGRINLKDCQAIRVPRYAYDENPKLMQNVKEMYGVDIIVFD